MSRWENKVSDLLNFERILLPFFERSDTSKGLDLKGEFQAGDTNIHLSISAHVCLGEQ